MHQPRFFPEATFDNLLKQSSSTADYWFEDAVSCIDAQFGKDFAKNNPSLIAAFMQSAAIDFHGATLGKAAAGLAEALELISSSVGVGDDVSRSLDSIADAISNANISAS